MTTYNQTITPSLLKVNERDAHYWLTNIVTKYNTSLFGSEFITKSSLDEYLLLRKALGATAGFRRNEPPNIPLISSINNSPSRVIVDNLTGTGWHLISNNILADASQATISQIQSILLEPRSNAKRSIQAPLGFASLLKHIMTPELYAAIKSYLGVERPTFYPPHILCSQPLERGKILSTKELSDRAFAFHRDYDNIRWLKLFVNLTSTKGGNHEYIQGSHHTSNRDIASDYADRTRNVLHEDPVVAYTEYETHLWLGRFHESSIKHVYGDRQTIRMNTNEGACWIEDTYGLHRGNPPHEGDRAVASFLIAQYPIRYSDI